MEKFTHNIFLTFVMLKQPKQLNKPLKSMLIISSTSTEDKLLKHHDNSMEKFTHNIFLTFVMLKQPKQLNKPLKSMLI